MAAMDKLLEQLRAQRTGRVEVAPGKVLLVRRPLEATEMPLFRGGVEAELVTRQVVGWEGITEADLLGAAVGASSPVPWSAELCAEVLADRSGWLSAAAEWLVQAIRAHLDARGEAAKN